MKRISYAFMRNVQSKEDGTSKVDFERDPGMKERDTYGSSRRQSYAWGGEW